MRLLLDTHVLLWWVSDDRKLRTAARESIASPENDVAVSAATFWEIAIKRAMGRIDIDLLELRDAVREDGFEEVSIAVAHTLELQSLPEQHRDPFDRLLIAQSIVEGRRLMTADKHILDYAGVAGFDPLPA